MTLYAATTTLLYKDYKLNVCEISTFLVPELCECKPNNNYCYNNNNNNVDSLSQGTACVLAGEVAALGDEAEAPSHEKISLCM